MNDIFWKEQTIDEAKTFLQEKASKGVMCPCCHRYTKIYERKLTSSMAYGLIRLYLYAEKTNKIGHYLHIENIFKDMDITSSIRGDFPKLRFWGLIEPSPVEEGPHVQNGEYRITERGFLFVMGSISVYNSVWIYNNKMIDKSKNMVNIHQALKNKFNYQELMSYA